MDESGTGNCHRMFFHAELLYFLIPQFYNLSGIAKLLEQ